MGNTQPGGVAVRAPSGDPSGPSSYRRAGPLGSPLPGGGPGPSPPDSRDGPSGSGGGGGGGGAGGGGDDELLSSLPGDLSTSSGGTVVRASRLRPGSGRRMRSYRVRFLVPGDDGGRQQRGGRGGGRAAPAGGGGASTVEVSVKCFAVSSGPGGGDAALRSALAAGEAELARLRSLLSDPSSHPHALPYGRWSAGRPSSGPGPDAPPSRPVYLLRQHVHSSLPVRLGSRPFPSPAERDWMAYQLLRGLRDLHAAGVVHGHLTPDNVLLTSWGWVLISDVGVSRYKPATLPDDDPGTYVHWYEGRGRDAHGDGEDDGEEWDEEEDGGGGGAGRHRGKGEERCCLAPERFVSPSSSSPPPSSDGSSGPLTPAADVFGLGCVLVELYTGERAMDLGDLMEYRRTGTMPPGLVQRLGRVGSSRMRAAVRHMMGLDPKDRLGAGEYLDRLSESSGAGDGTGGGGDGTASDPSSSDGTAGAAPFPDCLPRTVHPFLLRLRTEVHGPDARIALVACHYGRIMGEAAGVHDGEGVAQFRRLVGPELLGHELPADEDGEGKEDEGSSGEGRKSEASPAAGTALGEMSLDDLTRETELLLSRLGGGGGRGDAVPGGTPPRRPAGVPRRTPGSAAPTPRGADPPVTAEARAKALSPSGRSATSILLQVVLSSVGHVARVTSRVVALRLMHRISLFSTDEVRLQRIVPAVTSLLRDAEATVRSHAIAVLTSVLSSVVTFPPSDAQVYPRYVFAKAGHLISDPALIVRVAFAGCIPALAEGSLRFLDVSHSVMLYETVGGRRPTDHAAAGEGEREPSSSDAAGAGGDAPPVPADGPGPPPGQAPGALVRGTYDADLEALHEVVFRWLVHIATDASDHSSQSKRALLAGLPRLAPFLGPERSFHLLPMLLAFLNDRDWELRAALCRALPTVCASSGRAATERFVVPLIETALADACDGVAADALGCLVALAGTALLSRVSMLGTDVAGGDPARPKSGRRRRGLLRSVCPLLRSPSGLVRGRAVSFVLACWSVLDDADAAVSVALLAPSLRYRPVDRASPDELEACLREPEEDACAMDDFVDPVRPPSDLLGCWPDGPGVPSRQLAARRISVPGRGSSEKSSGGFAWYGAMHLAHVEDPTLSSPLFAVGLPAVQKVYGLTMDPVPNSCNSILIHKPDEEELAGIVGRKEDVPPETCGRFLTRPAVRVAESAARGQWGSAAFVDQLVPENSAVHAKLDALGVPPLPPALGRCRGPPVRREEQQRRSAWTPRRDALVATASEHGGPVNRISVSDDQTFFVSASDDGTSRVFELMSVADSGGDMRSRLTYHGHDETARVNNCTILKNTHSVATGCSKGTVHVWRVDTTTSQQTNQTKRTRVSGQSLVRSVDPGEGEVMALSQFYTSSASVVTYATQRGTIHTLDLRTAREPFALRLFPETGSVTDIQIGADQNWLVAGTRGGFLSLFDLRYHNCVKLWRHGRASPIKRLSAVLGAGASGASSRPLVFAGCDGDETALFDLASGGCLQCYRVLDQSLTYVDRSALPKSSLSIPQLEDVAIPSKQSSRLVPSYDLMRRSRPQTGYAVNAVVGNINAQGSSFLLTGSDSQVRCWNLNSTSKSCCVSGLSLNQPPPSFEQVKVGGNSRLILCRQPSAPPSNLVEGSKLPQYRRQGVVGCDKGHTDSILDLKIAKAPAVVLSASRDNTVKLWA